MLQITTRIAVSEVLKQIDTNYYTEGFCNEQNEYYLLRCKKYGKIS